MLNTCETQAYVVTLNDHASTLYLSTQRDFRTNYPFTYPVATVAVISKTSQVQYIVDADNGVDGLRPMILADNTVLNMGPTWNSNVQAPNVGLNITGNYAHSFVIQNQSNHNVYFASKALNKDSISENLKFWTLEPNSWTLMWPADVYWPVGLRYWNATALPEVTYDLAAYLAETVMYDVLAAKDPLAP